MVINDDKRVINVYYVGSHSKWINGKNKRPIKYMWLSPNGSYNIDQFINGSRYCFNANGYVISASR